MTDIAQIYTWLQKIQFIDNPHYRNRYDDISISDAFHEVFKNDLRFNATTREWYRYDEKYGIWEPDADSIVQQQCKAMARAVLQYAEDERNKFLSSADANDEDGGKKTKKFLSWAKALQNFNMRQRMEKDARSIGAFRTTDLDNNPDLINCMDKVLVISGPNVGERLDHQPDFLMTKCTNAYVEGTCSEEGGKRWDRFIDEILQGDREEKDYLQAVLGSSLELGNPCQETYFIWGRLARNGKTTLTNAVLHALGTYGVSAKYETFEQSSFSPDPSKARPDLVPFVGARFILVPEPERQFTVNASLLKQLTGGNFLSIRENYGKQFSFQCKAKIFFDTNHLPKISDKTLFDSSRISVIPFSRHFEDDERDFGLPEYFESQELTNYIFAWLLEGLRMSRETNLKKRPAAVNQAVQEYESSSDKVGLFISDVLQEDSSAEPIPIRVLYYYFEDWCRDGGMVALGKTRFIGDLKSRQLFSSSGTVNGKTVRNVVKGYSLTSLGREIANRYLH